MPKGFLRMNSKQKEYAPTGYILATNIKQYGDEQFSSFLTTTVTEMYHEILSKYRKLYGDVQVVSPAFDMAGNELKGDIVALYVPHPAIFRIKKLLRNINSRRRTN